MVTVRETEGVQMNAGARRVQATYLILLLLHTLAASFIWGINTLFLLDGGLSNTQAFTANAFFTAGMVIFEVPTGVVADTRGRRTSYLLGTVTLGIATLLYFLLWWRHAPFWAWAAASALLGLGFTFFSGAVEAWLVDALTFTGYTKEGGRLEDVFARGTIVEGVAMLGGSVAGGLVAQATNLGVPYLLRTVFLALSFVTASALMRDTGFTPRQRQTAGRGNHTCLARIHCAGARQPSGAMGDADGAVRRGRLDVRFLCDAALPARVVGERAGVCDRRLAAAVVAGAQIAGGLLVPHLRRVFSRRTIVLLCGTIVSSAVLAIIGLAPCSGWCCRCSRYGG